MKVDKTLSELWSITDHGDYGDTARMAINTIKKLEEENNQLSLELEQWKKAYHMIDPDPVGYILNKPLEG